MAQVADPRISPGVRRVAELIAAGLDNDAIARELNVAPMSTNESE